MLKIFKRRRHRSAGPDPDRVLDGCSDRRLDEALRINDLFDQPALRAVMTDASTNERTDQMIDPLIDPLIDPIGDEIESDAPMSVAWTLLIDAGPIRFDRSESTEVVA